MRIFRAPLPLRHFHRDVTFTGAAGAGAVGTITLATVTQAILIVHQSIWCETDLTEALATATLAYGVVGSTSAFIAATNAVDIDANEFWVTTTPTANHIAEPAAFRNELIGSNLILTVGAQAVDGGVLHLFVEYEELTESATLV